MKKMPKALLFCLAIGLNAGSISAQDKRMQYPSVLSHSYFGLDIGYINYGFSQKQLEPGYQAESVKVPHTAVRIILYGHHFNKYLSAQVTYMRPVEWIRYININGSQGTHQVGMNIAGLTAKSNLQLSKNIVAHAEAGLGIVTRSGFMIDNIPVVKDITYAGLMLGGEVRYQIGKKWELGLSISDLPAYKKRKQPATFFYGAGFNYSVQPLPAAKTAGSPFIFPRQVLQAGYSFNAPGYGINDFVSKGAVPIFWGGVAQVKNGFSISYQRNIFHTRRVFALDWGAAISYWKSRRNSESFYTASVYPLFRFTFLRLKTADIYFNYSVAGPSFISKVIIDETETGEKFTFRDEMGMGVFAGKKRRFNAEINIAHFSNGNLFPQNNGVMIPLTISAGYAFD